MRLQTSKLLEQLEKTGSPQDTQGVIHTLIELLNQTAIQLRLSQDMRLVFPYLALERAICHTVESLRFLSCIGEPPKSIRQELHQKLKVIDRELKRFHTLQVLQHMQKRQFSSLMGFNN